MDHSRPARRRMQVPQAGRLAACCVLLAALALPAVAQETEGSRRNVRTGYAKVLSVEPVYQTLTASRMEQECDGELVTREPPRRGLARVVGAVKDALTGEDQAPPPPPPDADCRMVKVEREFRRPIAYDVDYIFRGMKYRSRLPYDPGNRLKVQVSLTPLVQPPDEQ